MRLPSEKRSNKTHASTSDAEARLRRKGIEEVFGGIKKAPGSPRPGTARVGWMFTVTAAAYNPIRLPKLPAAA